MDMDCQEDLSDEDPYVDPWFCLEYSGPEQANDFSPNSTPPWRRLAPLPDYPALHEAPHAGPHLSVSEASYVPPHQRGPLNPTALASLLNMESVADEERISPHPQTFSFPAMVQRFDDTDAFCDTKIRLSGNLEYVTSDMDASASEEEDQDIESYSGEQEIMSVPHWTPPMSPESGDVAVQSRDPSPPDVIQAEAPSPIASPTTHLTIVHEDAADSGKDVPADPREHSYQPPCPIRPSMSPVSPRISPMPQLNTIDVPSPAGTDHVLSPSSINGNNARKRSREETDEEVVPEAEAFTPLVTKDVDNADDTAARISSQPITVDVPSSMGANDPPTTTHDDLPSPAKRARLSTAAGFVAGAVAGSALTWVGLAYL